MTQHRYLADRALFMAAVTLVAPTSLQGSIAALLALVLVCMAFSAWQHPSAWTRREDWRP